MKFVIIGGGIAGTTAAEELRKLNPDSDITIIEQEQHLCYSKVLLSNYVTGEMDREKIFLKKQGWYQKNNIESMLGVIVEKIDTKNNFVFTSQGREIPYDKLLIASGQEPKLFNQDKKGIVYFRTLDDADNLKSLISELRIKPEEQKRMIIAGGSFISMEYLHICEKLEIPATVILRSDGFWSKILSDETKKVLLDHAEKNGVQVITNSKFEIEDGDEFSGIILENGERIKGSILAMGIGVEPDKSWLKDSGIEVNRGVIADSFLKTKVDNIYAAGDVAEFEDKILGRRVLISNWTNAFQQARAVAKTMSGNDTEFEFVSSYATRLFGKEITFIGDFDRSNADDVQRIETEDAIIEVFNRKDKTVGAVIVGSAKQRVEITNTIQKQQKYAG